MTDGQLSPDRESAVADSAHSSTSGNVLGLSHSTAGTAEPSASGTSETSHSTAGTATDTSSGTVRRPRKRRLGATREAPSETVHRTTGKGANGAATGGVSRFSSSPRLVSPSIKRQQASHGYTGIAAGSVTRSASNPRLVSPPGNRHRASHGHSSTATGSVTRSATNPRLILSPTHTKPSPESSSYEYWDNSSEDELLSYFNLPSIREELRGTHPGRRYRRSYEKFMREFSGPTPPHRVQFYTTPVSPHPDGVNEVKGFKGVNLEVNQHSIAE